MKFGTFITKQRGEAIATDVRQAEQLGFESAWIAEHLIMPVKQDSAYPYSADGRFLVPPDAPFHDPLLVLAYVAALTTKIRLATGIFVLPLRNVFATAKAIATLDQPEPGPRHLRRRHRMAQGGVRGGRDEVRGPRAAHPRVPGVDDRAVEQERSALQGQDGCDPGDEVHAQDRPAAASADRLRRHQRARAQAHGQAGRRMVRDRAQPGRGADADFAPARVRARGRAHAGRSKSRSACAPASRSPPTTCAGWPNWASIARSPGFRSRRSRARSSSASAPKLSTRCSAKLPLSATNQKLWEPSAERVADARMTAFMRAVEAAQSAPIPDYGALWRWSVENRELFWRTVWNFCGAIGDQGGTIVADGERMPGARWFPEGRLNFAENCLRLRGAGRRARCDSLLGRGQGAPAAQPRRALRASLAHRAGVARRRRQRGRPRRRLSAQFARNGDRRVGRGGDWRHLVVMLARFRRRRRGRSLRADRTQGRVRRRRLFL